jgi:hypothetical protein
MRKIHRHDSINRKCEAALLGRKSVGQNRLRQGLQTSAAGSLKHAEQQQKSEVRGDATEQGTDGKNRHARHEEALASEETDQPSGNRENDGVGDQIRGEHPSALIVARAEVAGDVRQGDVRDGSVEHFHERGQRNGDGNEPGIGSGTPDGGWTCSGGHCRAHCTPAQGSTERQISNITGMISGRFWDCLEI